MEMLLVLVISIFCAVGGAPYHPDFMNSIHYKGEGGIESANTIRDSPIPVEQPLRRAADEPDKEYMLSSYRDDVTRSHQMEGTKNNGPTSRLLGLDSLVGQVLGVLPGISLSVSNKKEEGNQMSQGCYYYGQPGCQNNYYGNGYGQCYYGHPYCKGHRTSNYDGELEGRKTNSHNEFLITTPDRSNGKDENSDLSDELLSSRGSWKNGNGFKREVSSMERETNNEGTSDLLDIFAEVPDSKISGQSKSMDFTPMDKAEKSGEVGNLEGCSSFNTQEECNEESDSGSLIELDGEILGSRNRELSKLMERGTSMDKAEKGSEHSDSADFIDVDAEVMNSRSNQQSEVKEMSSVDDLEDGINSSDTDTY